MRLDVSSLLNRLGRSDFKYKEFTDRFSDLDSWPIFEAVLKDQRVLRHAAANGEASATPVSGVAQAPMEAALARKYGNTVGNALQRKDVRSVLAGLTASAEKGGI